MKSVAEKGFAMKYVPWMFLDGTKKNSSPIWPTMMNANIVVTATSIAHRNALKLLIQYVCGDVIESYKANANSWIKVLNNKNIRWDGSRYAKIKIWRTEND